MCGEQRTEYQKGEKALYLEEAFGLDLAEPSTEVEVLTKCMRSQDILSSVSLLQRPKKLF